ncbi:DUF4083 domain-containing protein [Pseudogracilibacillus auburnensis]|uniref:DUF4083 domain-containing protein n=1 Tax=Pseudogracilibacillus auburnensis TaxID=1494959 RepID=UPI001A960515|nr:DUF4083 domain-containing protein [Pseudogracilibacillus auburnensis]MBO1002484.1 DUF4083 domain-containing protein [Pseudogracilibacillus auburnensis]
MSGFHTVDFLIVLVYFGVIFLIIILCAMFFRSLSKRKNQLDNIEKKIDAIKEQLKKGND